MKKNHIKLCQSNVFVRIKRPFIFRRLLPFSNEVVKATGLSYEFLVVSIRDCVELSYTVSPTPSSSGLIKL